MNTTIKTLIFIVLPILQINAQMWDTKLYKENESVILESIDGFNKERYSRIVSVPVFRLKERSGEYDCGNDLYSFVGFSEKEIYQLIFLFEKRKVTGYYFPIIEENGVNYLFSDFGLDFRYFEKALNSKDSQVFSVDGLGHLGIWELKEGKVFALILNRDKQINLISSSQHIALGWGSEYINDVMADSVPFGKKYYPCD